MWGETAADGDAPPPWTSIGERPMRRPTPTHAVGEQSPPMLRRAAEEARALEQADVGASHLLLGILAEEDGAAGALLMRHGATLTAAREAAAATASQARCGSAGGTLSLSPRAMLAMHRATIETRRRGVGHAGELHLLLALVDNPQAAELPGLAAVDLEALRGDLLAALDA